VPVMASGEEWGASCNAADAAALLLWMIRSSVRNRERGVGVSGWLERRKPWWTMYTTH
jgi:hypothetical protein